MANYGISHSGHGNISNPGAVGQNATVINHVSPRSDPDPDDQAVDQADIGVITVLSEELRAVVDVLVRGREYERKTDRAGRVRHESLMPVDGGHLRVVAVQTTGPGQRPAALAFEHLRQHCAPAVVALVGIAGGIHRDLRLADVVVGDKVIYYDLRKEVPGGVLRRGESQMVPAQARRMINDFFSAHAEPLVMASGYGEFRALRGPIGSGEAVVAAQASEIRQFLTSYNDKTLALETEAGGVAQAFYESVGSGHGVQAWLVIRGVSDLADADKDDRYHDIAARHAALVFERMLPYLRVPRQP